MNICKIKIKTIFRKVVKPFSRDETGSIATMGSISILMILGCIGLAVDVSRLHGAQERLQNTVDAVSLMAARDKLMDQYELTTAAKRYFALSYPGHNADNLKLESITNDNDIISVTAANKVDTYLIRYMGASNVNFRSSSQAQYTSNNLNIALVLDTTHSMKGAKMSSLKFATNGLLKTLETLKNEEIQVSVVPFSQYINIGLANKNAPWVDVPNPKWIKHNGANSSRGTNCQIRTIRTARDRSFEVVRGLVCDPVGPAISKPLSSQGYNAHTQRRNAQGPSQRQSSRAIAPRKEKSKWAGCVGSRTRGYDQIADIKGMAVPGLLSHESACGTSILPLTDKFNIVRQKINLLKAEGDTYIPAGLLWGWRTLSNSITFANTAKRTPTTDERNALILMSDGKNFNSKNGNLHDGTDYKETDLKTAKLCQNIKNDNIVIYTIAYDITDLDTLNLLRNCATSPNNYYDASNAQQLNQAFKTIGSNINGLRLIN